MDEKEKILRRFQSLFQGHSGHFGRYPTKGETFDDDKPVMPWTEFKKELTDSVWLGHLTGKGLGLGIVPIREDGTLKFAAIDYDTKPHESDHRKLWDKIQSDSLPAVLCRSKSGGDHVYVFFTDDAPAGPVIAKMRSMAVYLGINISVGHKTEIFPKQTTMSASDRGSWINLPYYDGKETTRYCYGPDFRQLDLREFLDYAESRAVSSEAFLSLEFQLDTALHPQGPPCLHVLDHSGFPDGTRNQGLLNVGLLLERTNPEHWEQMLRDYNLRRMDPPLKDVEVEGTIKSLKRDFAGRRVYKYSCTKEPLHSACQRDQCKKRTYGIDMFGPEAANVIEALVKVEVDPPHWLAYIDGKPIEITTDELMEQRKFRKKALETINKLTTPVKQEQWDAMIAKLLSEMKVIEAPEDAGVFGQFRGHVRKFMEKRQSARWEDVLRHLPYEDREDGLVYFKSESLIMFLTERCKFRDYKPDGVYAALRKMGGGHAVRKVNGAAVNLWHLPSPPLGAEQDVPFQVRKGTKDEF